MSPFAFATIIYFMYVKVISYIVQSTLCLLLYIKFCIMLFSFSRTCALCTKPTAVLQG